MLIDTWRWPEQQRAPNVASLAAWLPRHAGLVQSLSLTVPRDMDPAAVQVEQQLLTMALQLSTADGWAPSREQTTAQPVAQAARLSASGLEDAAPPRLRIELFNTNYLVSPVVMDVLRKANLKSLQLDVPLSVLTPAACVALGQVTSLELVFVLVRPTAPADDGGGVLPPLEFAAAVGQLSKLTELSCCSDPGGVRSMPATIERLELVPRAGRDDGCCNFNLSHLTSLSSLRWTLRGGRPNPPPLFSFTLPSQALQQLALEAPMQLQQGDEHLAQHHIKHIELCAAASSELHVLQSFTRGQHLTTLYLQLPVEETVSQAQVEALERAAAAIGRCVGLKEVSIVGNDYAHDPEQWPPAWNAVPWCAELSKLPALQSVSLSMGHQALQDVLHLSRLTSLTWLYTEMYGSPDDFVTVALACSLTNLQHLHLCNCSLRTLACFPALGRLTALTELELMPLRNESRIFAAEHLQQLTALTRLQRLSLVIENEVSQEAKRAFKTGLPQLEEILIYE